MSAQSILIDVDDSTVLIGALPKDSFINQSFLSDGTVDIVSFDTYPLKLASTMTWVENFLNLTNGYYKVTSSEGDQFEYLVPFPPGFTSTMRAYWTTDVIVLDPSCSWQTTTVTTPPSDNLFWTVTIIKSNLSFLLPVNNDSMFILSSDVFMFTPSQHQKIPTSRRFRFS